MYTTSTVLRNILARDSSLETDRQSFKMLGVKMFLQNGAQLEEVMHHGRWRTLSMPLHYKLNSDDYKISIAKKV
jgi:hypothetical protein